MSLALARYLDRFRAFGLSAVVLAIAVAMRLDGRTGPTLDTILLWPLLIIVPGMLAYAVRVLADGTKPLSVRFDIVSRGCALLAAVSAIALILVEIESVPAWSCFLH
jgi:uncharacterized membrane protein YjgN (DUF898 family)